MQSAIDRTMQAYGMMLNLTPQQEAVEGLNSFAVPTVQNPTTDLTLLRTG